MFDETQISSPTDIDHRVNETIKRGQSYAAALLLLDPTLSKVNSLDEAVGFDIGAGTDAIAFNILGFQHATVTNDPSVSYQLMRRSFHPEEVVRARIKDKFPRNTLYSSMGISDFLQRETFSSRLTTMLRMAPRYFDDESNPASFFGNFPSSCTTTQTERSSRPLCIK